MGGNVLAETLPALKVLFLGQFTIEFGEQAELLSGKTSSVASEWVTELRRLMLRVAVSQQVGLFVWVEGGLAFGCIYLHART